MPIRHHRLIKQQLLNPTQKDPVDVLQSLVAVQSQDYYGAKWALGQRTIACTDNVVEQAFTAGRILRLHVMRPTWHFVAPEDIRWLLALTAPRVNAVSAYYFRKSELDQKTISKTNRLLTKALAGGNHLTRDQLRDAIQRGGVEPGDSVRLGHIMMRAELDGVVCSGARKGKQFTYALLAERAPAAKTLEEDEALGKLTGSYFASRGPAMLQDFVWWSGLTMAQVKRGVEIAQVKSEVITDPSDWSASVGKSAKGVAHLLPPYDEYFISYKDRSAAMHPKFDQTKTAESLVFDAPFTLDGLVVGGWQRVFGKTNVTISLKPFITLTKSEKKAVTVAAHSYGDFLETPAIVEWES
jgi:hypothetical protein